MDRKSPSYNSSSEAITSSGSWNSNSASDQDGWGDEDFASSNSRGVSPSGTRLSPRSLSIKPPTVTPRTPLAATPTRDWLLSNGQLRPPVVGSVRALGPAQPPMATRLPVAASSRMASPPRIRTQQGSVLRLADLYAHRNWIHACHLMIESGYHHQNLGNYLTKVDGNIDRLAEIFLQQHSRDQVLLTSDHAIVRDLPFNAAGVHRELISAKDLLQHLHQSEKSETIRAVAVDMMEDIERLEYLMSKN